MGCLAKQFFKPKATGEVDLDHEISSFFLILVLALMGLAFLFNTPTEIWTGSIIILTSPANLITDYFALANIGATLMNAGFMTLTSLVLVRVHQVKIAAEIMRYFLDHQIEQMNVDFEFSDWVNGITVSGKTLERPHDLEQLTAALKDGRQPEMDEYYHDLLGSDSKSQDYYLLGAMVDSADVGYDGTTLTVRVGRNRSKRQPERALNVLFPEKAPDTAPDPATGCRRKTRYR